MGYLLFDIESIVDGTLLAATTYKGLSPDEAIEKAAQDALSNSNGRYDFIPVTYHVPIVLGCMSLTKALMVQEIIIKNGEPADIVRYFWRLYARHEPILITFNGRQFDLPLLELMAMAHSITIPKSYWDKYGPRNRYANGHIDLFDWISNFGAHRVAGGLDAIAKMIGQSGKTGMSGADVRAAWASGNMQKINDYCIQDILNTYAVFLRSRLVTGEIDSEDERRLLECCGRIKPKYELTAS